MHVLSVFLYIYKKDISTWIYCFYKHLNSAEVVTKYESLRRVILICFVYMVRPDVTFRHRNGVFEGRMSAGAGFLSGDGGRADLCRRKKLYRIRGSKMVQLALHVPRSIGMFAAWRFVRIKRGRGTG